MNIFIGVALASLIKWTCIRPKDRENQILATVLLVTFAQVLATILIGVAVIVLRYFFVQRIFLYLIICHALLAVLGGYILIRWIGRSLNSPRVAKFMEIGLCAMFLISCFPWYGQYWAARPPSAPPCFSSSDGKLPESFQTMRVEIEGRIGYDLILEDLKIEGGFDSPYNFVVAVSRYLRACGIKAYGTNERLFLWRDKQKLWHATSRIPPDGEPLVIAHKPVSFSIKHP